MGSYQWVLLPQGVLRSSGDPFDCHCDGGCCTLAGQGPELINICVPDSIVK